VPRDEDRVVRTSVRRRDSDAGRPPENSELQWDALKEPTGEACDTIS
jgi:hypothetical protein